MDRTMLKIQMLYDDMGKSEKKVADFIISHPSELLPLSITELAEKSQSSEATIVRFARRLGLSGYQELKISIARESGNVVDNHDVAESDTPFDIFEKVTNDIYKSLEMTKQSLSKAELDKAAKAILSARIFEQIRKAVCKCIPPYCVFLRYSADRSRPSERRRCREPEPSLPAPCPAERLPGRSCSDSRQSPGT